MNLREDLHAQLKFLREERRLSLDELALKARVGAARIQAYELGEEIPSTQTILKLSNALEVPASNLLDSLETTK